MAFVSIVHVGEMAGVLVWVDVGDMAGQTLNIWEPKWSLKTLLELLTYGIYI